MGGIFQFGLAGLGITVVALLRKESFKEYGLTFNNIVITILLSACCCIPELIYQCVAANVHTWRPFSGVSITAEILKAGFPYNVLGMLIVRKITGNAWGCVLIFILYWNAVC